MQRFFRFCKENSTIISSIAGLIVIVIFVWGILKPVFRTPDCEVRYTRYEPEFPQNIFEDRFKVMDYLKKLRNLDQITSKTEKAYLDSIDHFWTTTLSFFYATQDKYNFLITNKSNKILKNLNIRIPNVRTMTAFAVGGDIFIISSEKDSILRSLRHDVSTQVAYLPPIMDFPPKSSLQIILWGSVSLGVFEDPIKVYYDGGEGVIIKETTVTGIKAFIVENYLILIILIIIFIFLFITLINARIKNKESSVNTNNT